MKIILSNDTLQYIIWFLALVEFVLALYILLLNIWHTANRHLSTLLMSFAINSLALGSTIAATDTLQATEATYLLAATSPLTQPMLLIITVVLLKPQWLRGRWRRLWWPVYGLTALPVVLTLLDVTLGTRLFYTGLDPTTYSGGYVARSEYTAGSLNLLISMVNVRLMGAAPIIFILYVALRDKEVSPLTRRLAWILLGAQITALMLQFGFSERLVPGMSILVTSAVFVFAYAYAAFQQIVSERRLQRGRLQIRMTVIMLGITIPLLLAIGLLMNERAGALLRQNAIQQLETANRALKANVSLWLDLNVHALEQLVSLPDIIGMDAERQKPLLEATQAAYPHISLVNTVDLNGDNTARSDGAALENYSGRSWFPKARDGAASVAFQSRVSRAGGRPVLEMAMPIRNGDDEIVGVAMFATELTNIAAEVEISQVGETGFAYVVDADDRVIAHPDPVYSTQLYFFSDSPPVIALRDGTRGLMSSPFTEQGRRWRAYVDELGNGWGIVVQQPEGELLSGLTQLRQIAGIILVGGVILVSGMAGLALRQALQPINSLTETVTAVAAGDLSQKAPVESEDEIGVLARAFNSMTEQLRDLIEGLESQVTSRTRDLERRTTYLEASAEVGRAAASILDRDQLIREVVEVIREQFGLYYVGLFLRDEAGEWAVLQAGTGPAGRAMLARGHRIRIGEGMVGWSVAYARARVALEAGKDAVRLATVELPDTRSEAAIPLRFRDQVLGALTVQDTQPNAFDQTTIAALQTMADQVALALENARLFTESQAALDASRRAYGELSRQAWIEILSARPDLAFRSDADSTHKLTQAEAIPPSGTNHTYPLSLPIRVHGQTIGTLDTYKPDGAGDWTPMEIELLEAVTEQLELALESARLYEETQRRAAREQLASEIATRMRETLDIETVLRTAVEEIHQVLGLEELTIQLSPEVMRSTDEAGRAGDPSAGQDNGSSPIGGSHA